MKVWVSQRGTVNETYEELKNKTLKLLVTTFAFLHPNVLDKIGLSAHNLSTQYSKSQLKRVGASFLHNSKCWMMNPKNFKIDSLQVCSSSYLLPFHLFSKGCWAIPRVPSCCSTAGNRSSGLLGGEGHRPVVSTEIWKSKPASCGFSMIFQDFGPFLKVNSRPFFT